MIVADFGAGVDNADADADVDVDVEGFEIMGTGDGVDGAGVVGPGVVGPGVAVVGGIRVGSGKVAGVGLHTRRWLSFQCCFWHALLQ